VKLPVKRVGFKLVFNADVLRIVKQIIRKLGRKK
jgi:hypothetical protein